MPRPSNARAFMAIAALLFHSIGCCAATQVKWTPNESDSNGDGPGPLPLSMKQREQLLKLEQAIAQSPDPEATLQRVAQSNQMSPEELWSMLQRNRADLRQGGAGGNSAGNPLSRSHNVLVKAVMSAAAAATHAAKKHPRWFVAVVAVLLVTAHVAHHGPRNGVVLSGPSRSGPRFRQMMGDGGPTTLWIPPADYCRSEFLESDAIPWDRAAAVDASQAPKPLLLSLEDLSALFEEGLPWTTDHEHDDEDGENETDPSSRENSLTFQWLDRKALRQHGGGELRLAALGRAVLTLDDLVPSSESSLPRDVAPMLALEAARDLLRDQQLTEFCQIRYHSRGKRGVLVVPGMGNWGLVGMLPLRKAKEPLPPGADGADNERDEMEESAMHLVLAAVPGYHWEGEIHVVVSLDDSDDVSVQTAVVVPAHGRAVSKAVAKHIVASIAESVATSIKARTRQALSRSRQSAAFQRRAKDKADQRRQSRQKKERELEEMAADRRRRWQRQNPNSGHYRPSGDRMRSPNNAVYR